MSLESNATCQIEACKSLLHPLPSHPCPLHTPHIPVFSACPVVLCPHYHACALSSHNLTLLSSEPLCTHQRPCPFLAKLLATHPNHRPCECYTPLPPPCRPSPCPSHRLTAHIQYFHRALNVTKDYTLLPISTPF